MEKQAKNNLILYIASFGILGFIPLIVDDNISDSNIFACIIGTMWTLLFLIVYLIKWFIYIKYYDTAGKWTVSETHTGYFRIKSLSYFNGKKLVKIHGIPIEIISNKNFIFRCETNLLVVEPKLIELIKYVI